MAKFGFGLRKKAAPMGAAPADIDAPIAASTSTVLEQPQPYLHLMRQVKSQPQALAAVTGLQGQQTELTFRQLFEQSKKIAAVLREAGVLESVKEGKEVIRKDYPLPEGVKPVFPLRFRVQMLAVGVNLFLETNGQSHLIAYPDFSNDFELRQKSLMQRFEFCLHSDLSAGASVVIGEMTAALSPGCGQADIRAITRPDGEPLIDEGRLWFTMTVRGRALPHPMQGVFSMNPSVFDIKFEGIIVFDTGDGMLRNELASHLFYDDASKEWRGWTVGFSAYGNDAEGAQKSVMAVSSTRDPRKGFSIMRAKPVGLPPGMHEDPHGIYDKEAGKWRMLVAEHAGKFRASIWESDAWDHGYTRLSGPVEMDSTGTSIQKIGSKRYAMFGSADRKVYVRTYPGLEPAGELNLHLPPWDDDHGTRIWPNVIPLPEGYPAPYIALMMDRVNLNLNLVMNLISILMKLNLTLISILMNSILIMNSTLIKMKLIMFLHSQLDCLVKE